MKISVTVNRGVQIHKKTIDKEQVLNEFEFSGSRVSELIDLLGLNSENLGLIFLNSRVVIDPAATVIQEQDNIEFYPLLMGG
jgi:molybdopterin converting factor small subunit